MPATASCSLKMPSPLPSPAAAGEGMQPSYDVGLVEGFQIGGGEAESGVDLGVVLAEAGSGTRQDRALAVEQGEAPGEGDRAAVPRSVHVAEEIAGGELLVLADVLGRSDGV